MDFAFSLLNRTGLVAAVAAYTSYYKDGNMYEEGVEDKNDDEEGLEDKNMDHYMVVEGEILVVVVVAMHPTFYSSI